MGNFEQQIYDNSDSYAYSSDDYSDDTREDPSFDVLGETRSAFSNLSMKKKPKTQGGLKEANEKNEEEDPDSRTKFVPGLAEQDQKSYENVQNIIGGGHIQKLKVDQCKIYLRKHGLRLSGNKDTLIRRIKEHIDIINGGGENIYPASSFVLNCKGDACMGDVVIFEQNVYEVFNIASRSGNGPCGTRVVAGRIVKESYGAAKQQHTFTIEVLWSKGEKPLPPLHPLLIKGRNLYRLKTMRQKWEDEGGRQKILFEKHERGGVARCNREARKIQNKDLKKTQKLNGETRKEHKNQNQVEQQKNSSFARGHPHIIPHNRDFDSLKIQDKPHETYSSANCSILGPFPRDYCKENLRPSDYVIPLQGQSHMNYKPPSYSQQSHPNHHYQQRLKAVGCPLVHEQKQTCPYYPRGRCYFGDKCRYLHK